jgi:hypothetical protein
MGILPYLYFVTSRCRHPLIRRQALQLLHQGPLQERIWHREVLARISDHIIIMEEAGWQGAQSSSDIPANARLSVINATIDSTQRTITLHYCRHQLEKDVQLHVIHEMTSYWWADQFQLGVQFCLALCYKGLIPSPIARSLLLFTNSSPDRRLHSSVYKWSENAASSGLSDISPSYRLHHGGSRTQSSNMGFWSCYFAAVTLRHDW